MAILSLKHQELFSFFSECCNDGDDDLKLFSHKDDPLVPLIKLFARSMCSALKNFSDTNEASMMIRKTMKIVFHKPEEVPRKRFAEAFLRLSPALEKWTEDEIEEDHVKQPLNSIKSFFERVCFKIALNESAHVCEAIRRIAQDWLLKGQENTQAEHVTTAIQECAVCSKLVRWLCVKSGDQIVCASCWFASSDPTGTLLRLHNSIEPPPVPPTHLLAHQRNLWENKTGVRHALLPDQRRAVISTSVHEVVTVRDRPQTTETGTQDDTSEEKIARVSISTQKISEAETPQQKPIRAKSIHMERPGVKIAAPRKSATMQAEKKSTDQLTNLYSFAEVIAYVTHINVS